MCYPTRGPWQELKASLLPSPETPHNCAQGQRDGLSVVWLIFSFFLLFHFVWVYFVCLFSLEVVVTLKHPEIAFMLLCFHVSFSKAQKICQRFATSTAWSEPVTWHGRILYPITQSYSHYMQLSLFSCIYTANIFIGKTVELTDH